MSLTVGLIVYKDAQGRWNEATNLNFINEHTMTRIIATHHEEEARKLLKDFSVNYDFEHYNIHKTL